MYRCPASALLLFRTLPPTQERVLLASLQQHNKVAGDKCVLVTSRSLRVQHCVHQGLNVSALYLQLTSLYPAQWQNPTALMSLHHNATKSLPDCARLVE